MIGTKCTASVKNLHSKKLNSELNESFMIDKSFFSYQMTNPDKDCNCSDMEAEACTPNISAIKSPNINGHRSFQVIKMVSMLLLLILMTTCVMTLSSVRSSQSYTSSTSTATSFPSPRGWQYFSDGRR
jgi:hypothetical protein